MDNSSLTDIAKKINDRVDEICLKYVSGATGEAYQAGEGIVDLINKHNYYSRKITKNKS